jgi:hypothetical protein
MVVAVPGRSALLTDLVHEGLQAREVDVAVATVALALSETIGTEGQVFRCAGAAWRHCRPVTEVCIISSQYCIKN